MSAAPSSHCRQLHGPHSEHKGLGPAASTGCLPLARTQFAGLASFFTITGVKVCLPELWLLSTDACILVGSQQWVLMLSETEQPEPSGAGPASCTLLPLPV